MEDPKVEGVPDLDDLLQCPVCYEIPTGQIFQCNEGHHVCGRCKVRLDVCPVCRAFFFGTRNYAMEELIANVRKLRSFKLGGKVTTGTDSTSPTNEDTEVKESASEENSTNNDEDDISSRSSLAPPAPCSGLFRCLCCKINPERLPSARLLNHLRYFHSPELIEGRSENGEYVQAWQFSTENGRIVTAIRVADMGLFFLVIEITSDVVYSWLSMAASPVVAEEFSYTFTLSGNDREAIFSDCVWSVRTCEGFLKKRGRCLFVSGSSVRALLSPSTMSAKLMLRRTPIELLPNQGHPRAILRVANRSHMHATPETFAQNLEPFFEDLRNNVVRLSRTFATFSRQANELRRSEAEMVYETEPRTPPPPAPEVIEPQPAVLTQRQETANLPPPPAPAPAPVPEDYSQFSRRARRRLRQRLREAIAWEPPSAESSTEVNRAVDMLMGMSSPNNHTPPANNVPRANNSAQNNSRQQTGQTIGQQNANSAQTNMSHQTTPRTRNNQGDRANNNRQNNRGNMTRGTHIIDSGVAIVELPRMMQMPPRAPPTTGPTVGQQNANSARTNAARQSTPGTQNNQGDRANNNRQNVTRGSDEPILESGMAVVEPPVAPPPAAPTTARASGNANGGRNKKKRRQR